MQTLRCGVSGLGRGKTFVEKLNQLDGCEVVAVCDPNPRALEGLGDLGCYTDYEQFITEPDLDVVAAIGPGPTHTPQALHALENGAHVIKTYFCEPDFEQVTHSVPVPIVIAGGKKLPELDALKMARKAIDQGAAGVDMGRNIFQAEDPVAMIQAVRAVVHDGEAPDKAFELYETLRNQSF